MKEIGEEDAARRGIGPSLVGQAATNSASVVELARCGATRCAGYVATNLRAPSLFAEMLGDALPRGTHRVIRGTDNSPRVPFLSIVRTRDFVHTRLLLLSLHFSFFFFFFLYIPSMTSMRFVESKPARIDRIVFTRVYFFARVIKFAGLKPDRDDVIGYRLNPSCHRETFSTREEGGKKRERRKKDISNV